MAALPHCAVTSLLVEPLVGKRLPVKPAFVVHSVRASATVSEPPAMPTIRLGAIASPVGQNGVCVDGVGPVEVAVAVGVGPWSPWPSR